MAKAVSDIRRDYLTERNTERDVTDLDDLIPVQSDPRLYLARFNPRYSITASLKALGFSPDFLKI